MTKKRNWRTRLEAATGPTPDISIFHFHVWEEIKYLCHEDAKILLSSIAPV